MWIWLVNTDGEVPIQDAIAQVVAQYDASLKAELTELSTDNTDFRHAICIVDENGKQYKRCRRIEELAGELLVEYGRARGGEPSSWQIEKWDFGYCTGYSMGFIGWPHEPTVATRLMGPTITGRATLRDREEVFVISRSEFREYSPAVTQGELEAMMTKDNDKDD